MESKDLVEKINSLGEWYHKIDLGNGIFTPGKTNQALTFELFKPFLPNSLDGLKVLDLGANSLGLSVFFAQLGAEVTAVEINTTFVKQAKLVREQLGLTERIEIVQGDMFCAKYLGKFDIVVCVGLLYHLRHYQLALDMLTHICKSKLFVSTQIADGDDLMMLNRLHFFKKETDKIGNIHGWMPTASMFIEMVASAGFLNQTVISKSPHPGESPGNILGNGIYIYAEAAKSPKPLPY